MPVLEKVAVYFGGLFLQILSIEIPYIVVVRAYYFIYSFYIDTKLTVCTKPVAVNDEG